MARERASSGQREDTGTPLEDLAPFPVAPAVPEKAPSPTRPRSEIEALCRTPSPESASRLLELLEAKALGGLKAADGRSLRFHAVQAVIQVGHPQALALSPEDVGFWAREKSGRKAWRRWLGWLLGGGLSAAFGLWEVVWLASEGAGSMRIISLQALGVLVALALSPGAFAGLAAFSRSPALRRGARRAMLVTGLGVSLFSILLTPFAGVLLALLGVGFFLLRGDDAS